MISTSTRAVRFYSIFNRKPKSKKATSSFKSFFKLNPEDRQISQMKMAWEVWRLNPTCRRISLGLKWFFALGFFLYVKQGVSFPGQHYMRLFDLEMRFKYATRGSVKEEGTGTDRVGRIFRYFLWKIEYAQKHGMLSVQMLNSDLAYITQNIIK